MPIHDLIKHWRASHKMSMAAFSRKVGCQPMQIAAIERGEALPSFLLMERICAYMGLPAGHYCIPLLTSKLQKIAGEKYVVEVRAA